MQKKKKNKTDYIIPSEHEPLVLSEGVVAYQKTSVQEKIAMGYHLSIVENPKNTMNYKEFNKIFSSLPFQLDEWAKFLGISERTLQRYELSNGHFSVLQTERIHHIKELSDLSEKLLGKSKSNFYAWATSKVFSLNGQKPIEFLTTYKGTELCMSIIQNTLYGGVA
jgi:uncharacterized protein (DUF2384 family)